MATLLDAASLSCSSDVGVTDCSLSPPPAEVRGVFSNPFRFKGGTCRGSGDSLCACCETVNGDNKRDEAGTLVAGTLDNGTLVTGALDDGGTEEEVDESGPCGGLVTMDLLGGLTMT